MGMAVDHGATHVIAVDLEVVGVIRKERFNDADFLRIIQCPWDLGNMLIFDKNNTKRILRLGYLDTLKAFNVYEGNRFCFLKVSSAKHSWCRFSRKILNLTLN